MGIQKTLATMLKMGDSPPKTRIFPRTEFDESMCHKSKIRSMSQNQTEYRTLQDAQNPESQEQVVLLVPRQSWDLEQTRTGPPMSLDRGERTLEQRMTPMSLHRGERTLEQRMTQDTRRTLTTKKRRRRPADEDDFKLTFAEQQFLLSNRRLEFLESNLMARQSLVSPTTATTLTPNFLMRAHMNCLLRISQLENVLKQ